MPHGCYISHVSLGDMPTKGARFRVSHISLVGESETHEETAARLNRLGAVDSSSSSSEAPEQGPLSGAGYEFHALIPGTKPLWATSYSHTTWRNEYSGESSTKRRDTLIGGAKDVEFALIEREDDMHVHMRYREGCRPSESVARERFKALLQAVAFIHGCEPWFRRLEVHRGIQLIEDTVIAGRSVPRSKYTFLTERTCSNGSDLAHAVALAMDFFSAESEVPRRISTLLHVARQAGAATAAFDLSMLGSCGVFEGITEVLYREARLEDRLMQESSELEAFKKAREQVLQEISARASADAGFQRLRSVISSTSVIRMREKLRALGEHFGLAWESTLKPAFDAWDEERHPGAHGSYRDDADEAAVEQRMYNKSRIAGASNLLVAKRTGYSGWAVQSLLEEKFVQL